MCIAGVKACPAATVLSQCCTTKLPVYGKKLLVVDNWKKKNRAGLAAKLPENQRNSCEWKMRIARIEISHDVSHDFDGPMPKGHTSSLEIWCTGPGRSSV